MVLTADSAIVRSPPRARPPPRRASALPNAASPASSSRTLRSGSRAPSRWMISGSRCSRFCRRGLAMRDDDKIVFAPNPGDAAIRRLRLDALGRSETVRGNSIPARCARAPQNRAQRRFHRPRASQEQIRLTALQVREAGWPRFRHIVQRHRQRKASRLDRRASLARMRCA